VGTSRSMAFAERPRVKVVKALTAPTAEDDEVVGDMLEEGEG
jgi:hypothetical protein